MNKILIFIAVLSVFTGCSTRGVRYYGGSSTYNNYSPSSSKRYAKATMRPYVVRGIRYYPTVVSVGDKLFGRASWYGPDFHGKLTSNGETYNMYDMTAAHKTLPMNTIVRVTSKATGKSAIVRINDRGPFVNNRIIDLSKAAAAKIDMIGTGTALVTLEVLGFAGKGKVGIPKQKELDAGPKEEVVTEFALQIGSFSNIEGAIRTQKKYDGIDGYKTIIKDMQAGKQRMFKVWLKGFQSEAEARDYKANGQFAGAFIVKE
ncbi:septal ring lytic transglycosylase RlpA family protein [Sulfurimonas sp. HSL-1716]|uniref:septal ring lytic transglycosylase RlpA family protein n=1 Tax=Hydrocurvibacter sulfurireducens TaxID=3131937 RepID=UPI0031F74134